MSVSSSSLDFKDTFLDGEERDIESTTTKIKDQDVLLSNTRRLLVKTIGNGCRSGLVDDAHDVQTSDDASVLCGLTLRVVEVGGNSDDSVLDGDAEVSFSDLTHLDEDHGRYLLGRELFLFAFVVDEVCPQDQG